MCPASVSAAATPVVVSGSKMTTWPAVAPMLADSSDPRGALGWLWLLLLPEASGLGGVWWICSDPAASPAELTEPRGEAAPLPLVRLADELSGALGEDMLCRADNAATVMRDAGATLRRFEELGSESPSLLSAELELSVEMVGVPFAGEWLALAPMPFSGLHDRLCAPALPGLDTCSAPSSAGDGRSASPEAKEAEADAMPVLISSDSACPL